MYMYLYVYMNMYMFVYVYIAIPILFRQRTKKQFTIKKIESNNIHLSISKDEFAGMQSKITYFFNNA